MTVNPLHESANIITYKHPITQANFLEFPKEIKIGADSNTYVNQIHSEIQQTAFTLYDMGLNVFPLPVGKKGGYPWKQLQYTRLDRNHNNYGLQMLFAGDCNLAIMCGRTSRNLFVIDCESKDSLEYHIAQMQKRSISLWVSATQRGGHIYMYSSTGEVTNIPTGTLYDAEIKGKNGYVLAPPSIHPSRKKYTWIYQQGSEPPTVSIHQIDWLQDTNGNNLSLEAHQSKTFTEHTSDNYPYSPLSKRTRNFIHNGHTTAEGSRNNELFSASCDMAGNNYSQSDTFQALFPPAHASGLDIREIKSTIRSAYSQPRTPAKPHQTQVTRNHDWQWALLFADNHKWDGRTATSKRAIFSALIHRAKLSSNEDGLFRASIREIATLARTGTATVQRILKVMQNKNSRYIIKCGYDKTSQATLWKFPLYIIQEAQQLNLDTLKVPPQWLSCSVSVFSQPDAIERTGLGYNGLLIYRAMTSGKEPIFPKTLTELTGLALHQVKYAMKKLASFDLIYREDEGWFAYVYDDNQLDMKVNEKKNIIGKGHKRAQRFAKERSVYAGRKLFFARLRYERDLYKLKAYDTLRQITKNRDFSDRVKILPIFREIVTSKEKCKSVTYRRIALSDLDDSDDVELVKVALSLGAEIFFTDSVEY